MTTVPGRELGASTAASGEVRSANESCYVPLQVTAEAEFLRLETQLRY